MSRRETKPAHREESRRDGKPGGMLAGVLIGLVIGLLVAAGLAWYFNIRKVDLKPVDQAPTSEAPARPEAGELPAEPLNSRAPPSHPATEKTPAKPKPHGAKPAEPGKSAKPEGGHAPIIEHSPPKASEPTSRVPLTFYGILPGEKPAKPVEPPQPKELWWLQVAALKNPGDADKLKARLALLGLAVSTQKVDSAGQSLYRVRVGPYRRDEDAFADLDTLSTNNYEPRLFKEPVPGATP